MGAKQRPPQQSGNSLSSLESSPGFVELDESRSRPRTESEQTLLDIEPSKPPKKTSFSSTIKIPKFDGKKFVMVLISFLVLIILHQAVAMCIEEFTVGGLGIFISTVVSMLGSCLGAVICFLLGRYLMRETVQQWVRKYPLFDAINIAAKEQGFKIMAMLYLTPVIPLGLVSYMCGTTSMNVYAFAFAKIFALPLYLIYTFMGASAHSFVKRGSTEESVAGISASDQAKKLQENQYLVVSGLVLSVIMMTLITRHIRKELMKQPDPTVQILDEQKKDKPGQDDDDDEILPHRTAEDPEDIGIELGLHPRRRGAKAELAD